MRLWAIAFLLNSSTTKHQLPETKKHNVLLSNRKIMANTNQVIKA